MSDDVHTQSGLGDVYDTTSPDAAPDAEKRRLAERIIERIEKPRAGGKENLGPDTPGGRLPSYSLPGFGDAYDDCREDMPHFCDDCGKPIPVPRTCARSTCPECAPAWVLKRAGTSYENSGGSTTDDEELKEPKPGHVGKLLAAAKMMSANRGGESVKHHHVVFSPPRDWFLQAQDPLDKTFKLIGDILTNHFDAAGRVYYHGWSGGDDLEDDLGEWKNRLFEGRDWETDVRHELEPRPHFHAVVASPFIPGEGVTDRIHDETGWVIKRIADEKSKRSIDGIDALARVVTYCMSHTSIKETDHGNFAQMRAYGNEYKEVDVYDDDRRRADRAVREVAPHTLGIPARDIECYEEVPADECDDHDHLDELEADADGDGDDQEADPDEVEMRPCKGAVRPIDEAPDRLEDAEWRARATRWKELQTTFDDWMDDGGGYLTG
ncbi:hypothetical protein SAMN04488063_0115 [Halopelagius inordinatus]|uniref:Uncharacterized protein n=1 Tax=Halopelagius inordinatus TaxID=553467 RepID=A0A1I2X2V6_9EURY|nr:hypothetical protein [Halopelagius inordinatus]SFH07864.1 hypothetical protein SAMN04488063_0115 [Halopelagius inordinatus]